MSEFSQLEESAPDNLVNSSHVIKQLNASKVVVECAHCGQTVATTCKAGKRLKLRVFLRQVSRHKAERLGGYCPNSRCGKAICMNSEAHYPRLFACKDWGELNRAYCDVVEVPNWQHIRMDIYHTKWALLHHEKFVSYEKLP